MINWFECVESLIAECMIAAVSAWKTEQYNSILNECSVVLSAWVMNIAPQTPCSEFDPSAKQAHKVYVASQTDQKHNMALSSPMPTVPLNTHSKWRTIAQSSKQRQLQSCTLQTATKVLKNLFYSIWTFNLARC